MLKCIWQRRCISAPVIVWSLAAQARRQILPVAWWLMLHQRAIVALRPQLSRIFRRLLAVIGCWPILTLCARCLAARATSSPGLVDLVQRQSYLPPPGLDSCGASLVKKPGCGLTLVGAKPGKK